MWILPKNYPLSSRFALDMVESKEDLTLPGLNIESSLMWRSKPSALPTWLRRWKPASYLPHLFTRILKPSQRTCFETALTSSLAVTHANPFQQQENDLVKMTQGTCGHTSESTSKQYDLLDASLKMSKDTSRLDSPQSSATWKMMVISQRGEYSQRVKSALLTKEKESTFWPTVTTDSASSRTKKYAQGGTPLSMAVNTWPTQETFPTPGTTEHRSDTLNLRHRVKQHQQLMLCHHVRLYPTPSARDWKDRPGMAKTAVNPDGSERKRNDQLARAVYATENPISGHLNPDWVEWLMGVPTGWTELGSWGTELCPQLPQKHGVS
tara:strand:- start:245 stop:1213 length:969 start_codon:yes stop_codon:yes gene_type:complete